MRKMKDSGIEWIGEIPENWKCSKSKYYIQITNGSDPKTEGDIPVYGSGSGCFKTCGESKEGPAVLLGRKGTVDIPQYVEGKFWNVDTAFDVKTDENKLLLKYYFYLSTCFDYRFCTATTTLPSMTQTSYENMFIPVPDIAIQHKIVTYIESKCEKLDTIIVAKKKTNELLKERRQSIIYEAVTKGLDPTVPMKDSGIEWIGEIPESWSFSKLKYDAYMKGRIGWQGLKADEFIEEGPYLVTGTDFEDGKVRWERSYHISEERFNEAPEIQLKEQDLLITKDGTIGKLAYIDYLPGLASLNSHLLVIRPKRERFLNKYLYWVLSSDVFFQYTEYAQDGTIMASLSQEKISQFVFGLPSIQEQQMIAKYLDEQCAEIDALISGNESTIEKLKEYRQSVIYEAVTGKVEI